MNIGWLLKTMGVGMIPLLIRVVTVLLFDASSSLMLNPVDIIFFGLSTCLSCLLQLSSIGGNSARWNRLNAFLIWIVIVIILLTFELGAVYMTEVRDTIIINNSVALTVASLLLVIALSLSGLFVYKFQNNR